MINRTVYNHHKSDDSERIIKKLRNLRRNSLHVKIFIPAGSWKIQISKIECIRMAEDYLG